MTFLQTDVTDVFDIETELVAADTTVAQQLIAPQLKPISLPPCVCSNNDTIDHHVELLFVKGGIETIVSAFTVPQIAGTTPGIAQPNQTFPISNPSQPNAIGAGVEVKWRVEEAVTSTNRVTLQWSVAIY